jgi:hypothetical protein
LLRRFADELRNISRNGGWTFLGGELDHPVAAGALVESESTGCWHEPETLAERSAARQPP